MSAPKERRVSPLRRALNDAFRDPQGRFSVSKVIAVWGQALCGWLLIHHAEKIIEHWDALALLLAFLIAPDIGKKWLTMHYLGATQKGIGD